MHLLAFPKLKKKEVVMITSDIMMVMTNEVTIQWVKCMLMCLQEE